MLIIISYILDIYLGKGKPHTHWGPLIWFDLVWYRNGLTPFVSYFSLWKTGPRFLALVSRSFWNRFAVCLEHRFHCIAMRIRRAQWTIVWRCYIAILPVVSVVSVVLYGNSDMAGGARSIRRLDMMMAKSWSHAQSTLCG